MQNKNKSTLKILDYLQTSIPSEKELTNQKPGVKKPKSVSETEAVNELDKDFVDAADAAKIEGTTIDKPVEAQNMGSVNPRKKKLIDSLLA
jgi:hypothetical protein